MRRISAGTLGLMIAIAGGGSSLLAEPPVEPTGTTSEAATRLAASTANRVSSVGASVEPNTYGTAVETALYVGGAAFASIRPNVSVFDDGFGSAVFSGTGAGSVAWAPINLPQGAQITGADFYFFDANTTTDFSVQVWEFDSTGGFNPVAEMTSAGSGGWGSSTGIPTSPWTVNNNINSYAIYVFYSAPPVSDLKWRGVKIRYKLQVSPSPLMATFTDVPLTDARNKFVEALYNAGITAGCGGGKFCPDTPLTRGQMAVFLAAALGLQWN